VVGKRGIQLFYCAAWTNSGFLFGCSHEHKTVTEAKSCIPCAGGYVVAVENGAMRALKAEEENEFQCGPDSHSTAGRYPQPLEKCLRAAAMALLLWFRLLRSHSQSRFKTASIMSVLITGNQLVRK
jgi:hypothetical protein